MTRRRRTPVPVLLVLVVAAALYVTQHAARNPPARPQAGPETHSPAPQPEAAPAPGPQSANDNALVARLYAERRSNVVVEVDVTVERTLHDDTRGSPHQKFVVRVDPNLTVLVAHNTALAARVPVQRGSRVRIRGEYEWSNQGGVLHWTHRDPARRHQNGWIEFEGRRYE